MAKLSVEYTMGTVERTLNINGKEFSNKTIDTSDSIHTDIGLESLVLQEFPECEEDECIMDALNQIECGDASEIMDALEVIGLLEE